MPPPPPLKKPCLLIRDFSGEYLLIRDLPHGHPPSVREWGTVGVQRVEDPLCCLTDHGGSTGGSVGWAHCHTLGKYLQPRQPIHIPYMCIATLPSMSTFHHMHMSHCYTATFHAYAHVTLLHCHIPCICTCHITTLPYSMHMHMSHYYTATFHAYAHVTSLHCLARPHSMHMHMSHYYTA